MTAGDRGATAGDRRVTAGDRGTKVTAEPVQVPGVPARPDATWSDTLRIGAEIVTSGATAHPVPPEGRSAYDQATAVLRRLGARIEAASGHRGNIYKLVVYLTDIADKDEVARARRDFFGSAPYPCSTLVQVGALAFPDCTVEIDAWARLDVDLTLRT